MKKPPEPAVRINAHDLAPVREFMAKPIGHHSAALDAILSVLRAGPISGKYCLICLEPHRAWAIGVLSGMRGVPPRVADNRIFSSLDDAERAIFKLRWVAHTGVPFDVEDPS